MQAVAVEGFREVVFGNPVGCDHKDGLWASISGRWFKISSDRTSVPACFPITPAMITDTSFCGLFGRMETEGFAALLVRYAQSKGGWMPVTLKHLNWFAGHDYREDDLEFFEKLGFLVKKDGYYLYTKGFVTEVLR
jgi:hypothetical protein